MTKKIYFVEFWCGFGQVNVGIVKAESKEEVIKILEKDADYSEYCKKEYGLVSIAEVESLLEKNSYHIVSTEGCV